MSTPTWIKDLIRGGLPAALDLNVPAGPASAPQTAAKQFTEKTPPQDIAPQSVVPATESRAWIPGISNTAVIVLGATALILAGLAMSTLAKR